MLVALSAAFFANKSQNTETSLLMRNVEALARGEDGEEGEDGLDTGYTPAPYQCTIHVGAKGKIKLLGGTIIYADANGYVTFEGARDCVRSGNSTCAPVTCVDIYTSIF